MKKYASLLSVFLALLLLFSLFAAVPTVAAEVSYERGDVNGDGKVSPYDALMVLRQVVGSSPLNEDQTARASVVSSAASFGSVSVSECVAILKKASGKITETARFSDLSAAYSASSVQTGSPLFSYSFADPGSTAYRPMTFRSSVMGYYNIRVACDSDGVPYWADSSSDYAYSYAAYDSAYGPSTVKLHPGLRNDTGLTFSAPCAGKIFLSLSATIVGNKSNTNADGIALCVYRNGEKVYPLGADSRVLCEALAWNDLSIPLVVRAGDAVTVGIDGMTSNGADATYLKNIRVTYTDYGVFSVPTVDDSFDLSLLGHTYVAVADPKSTKRICVYDVFGDWSSPVKTWTPTTGLGFTSACAKGLLAGLDEVKYTYSDYYQKYVLLTASSSGYAAVSDYETGACLRQFRIPNGPHSIDLLPNGTVLVASSGLSDWDTAGYLYVYAASTSTALTGTTTSGWASRSFLPSAHGVIWDEANQCIWACGMYGIYRYTIAGTELTFVRQYCIDNTSHTTPVTTVVSGGHDLSVYGEDSLITTGSSVYVFNKTTGAFVRTPEQEGSANGMNTFDFAGALTLGNCKSMSTLPVGDGRLFAYTIAAGTAAYEAGLVNADYLTREALFFYVLPGENADGSPCNQYFRFSRAGASGTVAEEYYKIRCAFSR